MLSELREQGRLHENELSQTRSASLLDASVASASMAFPVHHCHKSYSSSWLVAYRSDYALKQHEQGATIDERPDHPLVLVEVWGLGSSVAEAVLMYSYILHISVPGYAVTNSFFFSDSTTFFTFLHIFYTRCHRQHRQKWLHFDRQRHLAPFSFQKYLIGNFFLSFHADRKMATDKTWPGRVVEAGHNWNLWKKWLLVGRMDGVLRVVEKEDMVGDDGVEDRTFNLSYWSFLTIFCTMV